MFFGNGAGYRNECVKCGNKWETLPKEYVELDEIGIESLEKYGQLYSVCEDCNGGVCELVESPDVIGFQGKLSELFNVYMLLSCVDSKTNSQNHDP